MEGDEVFLLLGCLFLTATFWGKYYRESFSVRCQYFHLNRIGLQIVPVLSVLVIFVVLRKYGAQDVRNSGPYLLLYTALGTAWLGLVERMSLYLGMRVRDDCFERNNASAAVALGGLLVASATAFAGANVGEGLGWYVVVFCALLSTGGLIVVFWLLDLLTGVQDSVTVERDLAAGIRVATFFLACGFLLGESVAGDWVSLANTLSDYFTYSWRILILLVTVLLIERALRPWSARQKASILVRGFIPSLAYISIAIFLGLVLKNK